MAARLLRDRSIRTWAWLGDAVFEQEVRTRVAMRGDFSVDRLDAIKADIVRAESQAELLGSIRPALHANEDAICRRARNAAPPSSARARRAVKAYRDATAFEALIAHWWEADAAGRARFEQIVAPVLEAAIDAAVIRRSTKLKRG